MHKCGICGGQIDDYCNTAPVHRDCARGCIGQNDAKKLRAEVSRLQQWVNDLLSGMYVNCVYCGHRYGPSDEVPASMAEVLKEHIEHCPEHPMSKLKAELAEYHATHRTPADIERLIVMAEELFALRKEITDGQLVRLPSESDDTIRMVEAALDIKLYDWQKAYILGLADYVAPGRCTGKTLAHMIRFCLSKGEPILGWENIPIDEHHGPQYQKWYARHLEDIYFKLQKQHPWLKLRMIKFYRSDRPQHRCDLMNGHRETPYSSYGDAAASVKEPRHDGSNV